MRLPTLAFALAALVLPHLSLALPSPAPPPPSEPHERLQLALGERAADFHAVGVAAPPIPREGSSLSSSLSDSTPEPDKLFGQPVQPVFKGSRMERVAKGRAYEGLQERGARKAENMKRGGGGKGRVVSGRRGKGIRRIPMQETLV
ncbi:hypothetical protein JCM8547_006772 [Rhodosporidiobolus lusitaniae]